MQGNIILFQTQIVHIKLIYLIDIFNRFIAQWFRRTILLKISNHATIGFAALLCMPIYKEAEYTFALFGSSIICTYYTCT